MIPRYYQKEAVEAVLKYFDDGNIGNPLIVQPTGSGKTHTLAYLCQQLLERDPRVHVLILTHQQHIITQDTQILVRYIPRDLVGIYSAGLRSRDRRQFTIAGIQSVYSRASEYINYDYVIVDECHLIPEKGTGRYRTFLSKLPNIRIIGLTATPYRRGHGYLTHNHLFDQIISDVPIKSLIKQGYLCNLRSKAPNYTLKTDNIRVVMGDFTRQDMSHKLDKEAITIKIIQELLKYKYSRKSWKIFAIDIQHAENITKLLEANGILSAVVHSKMKIDPQIIVDLFKAGAFQALVSVESLTTGFDAPNIDLLVLMRPTVSPVLHTQMIGRGSRFYDKKQDCLVLDFAGNIARLGPIDDIQIKDKKPNDLKKKTGFSKTCPRCNELVSPVTAICPDCGYKFEFKSKLKAESDNNEVLSTQTSKYAVEYPVKQVYFNKHNKRNSPPSLKVTYRVSIHSFFHEWIPFEHAGYPRVIAENWWKELSSTPIPKTVDEALKRKSDLTLPKRIRVSKIDKYPKVIARLKHEY